MILVINIVIHRDKSGLPVVRVNNIRLEVDILQHFEHCSVEEYKSFTVIVEAVKTVTREIILVVDEIIGYAVPFRFKDAAILFAPGNIDRHILHEGHFLAEFRAYALIERYNDTAFMSGSIYGLWQRAYNVSKSSLGCERYGFA